MPLLPQKSDGHSEFEFDGASYSGAVFNLSTTIVGAGIMALPETLKQLGTIPGLIVIILGAMLTQKSIEMILKFSRISKATSYANLAGQAFGGAGRTLLQVCIVINNVGTLVVYMIIIGIDSKAAYFLSFFLSFHGFIYVFCWKIWFTLFRV